MVMLMASDLLKLCDGVEVRTLGFFLNKTGKNVSLWGTRGTVVFTQERDKHKVSLQTWKQVIV